MTIYTEQEAKKIIGLYIQEYSGGSTDLEDAVNSLIELKCEVQRENDIASLVNTQSTEIIHNGMEKVVSCVCCGVQETQVLKYRVKDVKFHKSVNI